MHESHRRYLLKNLFVCAHRVGNRLSDSVEKRFQRQSNRIILSPISVCSLFVKIKKLTNSDQTMPTNFAKVISVQFNLASSNHRINFLLFFTLSLFALTLASATAFFVIWSVVATNSTSLNFVMACSKCGKFFLFALCQHLNTFVCVWALFVCLSTRPLFFAIYFWTVFAFH